LKERLINKYKEDSQEKNNIDKKIVELKKVIDSYKKSISEVEKEMKVKIKFIKILIYMKG